MIRQGSKGIFLAPEVILKYIDQDLTSEDTLCRSSSKDSGVDTCSAASLNQAENVPKDTDSVLSTCLTLENYFCTVNHQKVNVKEEFVASLYDQVDHMSDNDPIKQRILKQVNKPEVRTEEETKKTESVVWNRRQFDVR